MSKRRLTAKQRGLIRALSEGKTVAEAAQEAGYSGSRETARVEAHRALQSPHVSEALEKALDRAGATLDASARVIAEAHKADDPKTGKADHQTRLKASELNYKARRVFAPKDDGSGRVVGIGFFIAKGLRERGLEQLIDGEVVP